MIARHSLEQSGDGEGVEVVENKECEDAVHGKGQYTEKRIHLSRLAATYLHFHLYIIFAVLFQSTPILDSSRLSEGILCDRKSVELLSIHNNR